MDPPQQQTPEPAPPYAPRNGLPPFQFSLKWLMISVTVLAVLLAIGIATGGFVIGLLSAVFLRGILPTLFVVGAIYARRDLQAFSLGALVSCIPLLTTDLGPISTFALVSGTISQLFVAVICGFVAVAARRWIVRHGLGPEDRE